MQKWYKELLITDDMKIARAERAKGTWVVLCYPLVDSGAGECGGGGQETKVDMSEFPYAIENTEELDENYLDHILCRFKGIPCHILDTARCRVREITPADVDRLYEIYAGPGITDFMEPLFEKREDEIAYTEDYIRYHYGFYDFGMWIVEEKESGTVIGRAGFDMREGYEEPELGFVIAADCQGQGFATEVCEALLVYGEGELGFHKVLAFTEEENIASVRLLEKLGFEYQGRETLKTVKEDGLILSYYSKNYDFPA